jgi:hypothetical protein
MTMLIQPQNLPSEADNSGRRNGRWAKPSCSKPPKARLKWKTG